MKKESVNDIIVGGIPPNTTESKESDLVGQVAAAYELAKNPAVVREIRKYGKTPVVYIPTKEMAKPPHEPSLLHFIQNAMTVSEVNNLLKKGLEDYQFAREKTIQRWKEAAVKRIEELIVIKEGPKKGQHALKH